MIKKKSIGKELSFLIENLNGCIFLFLLIITVIFVGKGLSGIDGVITIAVPLVVAIMLIFFTSMMRKDIDIQKRILIYILYPFLFIICTSGSFNSLFTILSREDFYTTESKKWQTNLSTLKTGGIKLLNSSMNIDSFKNAIASKERQLIFEIQDGGFKTNAKNYFYELDTLLGVDKLRMPSRGTDIETAIQEIKDQVKSSINLREKLAKYQRSEVNKVKGELIGKVTTELVKLSSIDYSSSSDPIDKFQDASNIFTVLNSDIEALTEERVIISTKDLEVNRLNTIFDTLNLLSSPENRKRYLFAMFFAFIVAVFIEGGTILLSFILGSRKSNDLSELLEEATEEINVLDAKIDKVVHEASMNVTNLQEKIESQNETIQRLLHQTGRHKESLRELMKRLNNLKDFKSNTLK
jgi:hypothetical protein